MTGRANIMKRITSVRPGRRAAFLASAAVAALHRRCCAVHGERQRGLVAQQRHRSAPRRPTTPTGDVRPDGQGRAHPAPRRQHRLHVGLHDRLRATTTGKVQPGDEGEFQHPGPVLCVTEGDTVTIVLHNKLKYDDVSIVFPGQTGVTADGAPVQPQFSGSTVTSLAQAAGKDGGTITYTFKADHAGTFLYESGTEPAGAGARWASSGRSSCAPPAIPNWVYDRADSQFNPGSEYMVLLSEIDPYLNQRMEPDQDQARRGPDAAGAVQPGQLPPALLAHQRSRLPGLDRRQLRRLAARRQPYGALAEIQPKRRRATPHPSLDRYLERRHPGLPVPPPRQQREDHRPRRPPAPDRGRRGPRRSTSSRIPSAPARPGTRCSSGPTRSSTTPTPTRSRRPTPSFRTWWSGPSTAAPRTSGTQGPLPPGSRRRTSAASTTSSPTTTPSFRSPHGA